MKTPKVSVLIPLYNCSEFIEAAVNSVLNQELRDFEVIIVDNCSTDGSYEKVKKFEVDSRVKVFQNDTNIGMARNWNQCMLYSRGEYIKFLCADDFFEPNLLLDYVETLDKYPNVALVTSPRQILYSDGRIVKYQPYIRGVVKGGQVLEDCIEREINPLGEPTSVMFRRKHMYIGMFNEDLNWIIDIDYWLRICQQGDVYGLEKHYSYFRQSDQQGTADIVKSGKFLLEERNFLFYNFFIRNSQNKNNKRKFVSRCKKELKKYVKWGSVDFYQATKYLEIFPLIDTIDIRILVFATYTYRWLKYKTLFRIILNRK